MRKVYKCTEEHKRNISLGKTGGKRRFFGRKPITEIARKNMSIAQIGKTNGPRSEEVKKKISITKTGVKRAPFSIETRKNMSLGKKGKKGHTPTKETRKKLSEWNVAHPNRKFKDTSIELKIEEELIKRGINYIKQVPLCKISRVDFYLPEYRIVIQADGCYWHNCPIHFPEGKKGRQGRDKEQDFVLTFNGFNVYRFWEHEINESVESCIDRLMV